MHGGMEATESSPNSLRTNIRISLSMILPTPKKKKKKKRKKERKYKINSVTYTETLNIVRREYTNEFHGRIIDILFQEQAVQ